MKFKIGDFSRLSRVPVSTLRYYDDIGLFKAAEVDTFSGYRFYTVDQMVQLNYILALRDLGFTLDQIARQLEEDLSLEQMKGMLKMKKAEIQQNIDKELERLARVETRLQQIDQQKKQPNYEIVLKDIDPCRVIGLRGMMPSFSDVVHLFDKVYAHIGRYGARAAGPALTLYHDKEFREDQIDMEAAAPIHGSFPDDPPIITRELAGCLAASAIHSGSYTDLWRAWHALGYWVAANNLEIAGPSREVYLREGPGTATDEYVTEIQLPVKNRGKE